MTESQPCTIRLDKWLFYARIAKSRTLAQKLIKGSNVRINGTKSTNPARPVGPGDVLTLPFKGDIALLQILNCGSCRGPFSEAVQLYDDLTPPKTNPPAKAASTHTAKTPRPQSRDRKQLAALKRSAKLFS